MFQRAVFFVTVLGIAMASAVATADSLRGFMERHADQRYLRMETTATDGSTSDSLLLINPLSDEVKTNLFRLKTGDFVVAQGSITPDGQTVQIEAIESLGISALVGKWTTDRDEVYDFVDFSQMSLYVPSADAGASAEPGIVKVGDFQYSIAPDQGRGYSIFLTGNQTVTVGSIQFHKGHVTMDLIDPKTGLVTSSVFLSPLPFAGASLLK